MAQLDDTGARNIMAEDPAVVEPVAPSGHHLLATIGIPQHAGGGEPEDSNSLVWTLGWFVAFSMAASDPVALVVGQILEVVVGEEGEAVLVHWFSPKRSRRGIRRHEYGRGGREGGGRRITSQHTTASA